jgi:hypothetical protein
MTDSLGFGEGRCAGLGVFVAETIAGRRSLVFTEQAAARWLN